MRQTTLSVPLEVKPESCARLGVLIDSLREKAPQGFADPYAKMLSQVPTLHFLSISVFHHQVYDPLFVLEANFDGPSGVFWGQLEAAFGPELRDMLRCCKKPLDEAGPLYLAVTDDTSRAPVAPYFETRAQKPSVFHHGNRGMTRNRILQEAALFVATRQELANLPMGVEIPYAHLSAVQLHDRLRTALQSQFPWLDQPSPVRISGAERLWDVVRLVLFAVICLIGLTAPGIALALASATLPYLVLIAISTLVIGSLVYRVRLPRPGEEAPGKVDLVRILLGKAVLLILLVAAYVLVASAILILPLRGLALLHETRFWPWNWRASSMEAFRAVALGLASLPLMLTLLLLSLRHLERRDSAQDQPSTDPKILREMAQREDWIAQNHMGSVVLLKAGVLRTTLVKVGHLGLGLVLRVIATNGYLGSMRTVHFAHWAFVNNSSRLMFLSNFDHSWGSYLDDFIEKASGGLTLAWGAGVGFPITRFLVLDGASHGRQFKAWALASRAVSRFWFSAYSELTVDQIERQNRIADGLRKPRLTLQEAEQWRQDL